MHWSGGKRDSISLSPAYLLVAKGVDDLVAGGDPPGQQPLHGAEAGVLSPRHRHRVALHHILPQNTHPKKELYKLVKQLRSASKKLVFGLSLNPYFVEKHEQCLRYVQLLAKP